MDHIEFTVLLIEPDASNLDQLRETLTQGAMRSSVFTVSSYQEAIAFLHREEGFAGAPRPDAIVISWNLAPTAILSFERALQREPGLRRIPMIKLLTATPEKKHSCHHRSQAA
jgi:CheY-like chemotaxis protein